MVKNFPNSKEGTKIKVENYYRNSNDDRDLAGKLSECDKKGPLCVNIVKLYPNEVGGGFYAFGRVISGIIHE